MFFSKLVVLFRVFLEESVCVLRHLLTVPLVKEEEGNGERDRGTERAMSQKHQLVWRRTDVLQMPGLYSHGRMRGPILNVSHGMIDSHTS
jgi:hypothetical protein